VCYALSGRPAFDLNSDFTIADVVAILDSVNPDKQALLKGLLDVWEPVAATAQTRKMEMGPARRPRPLADQANPDGARRQGARLCRSR
jgi:hypothetical protein